MGIRVDRPIKNFQQGPVSVRRALRLIVAATVVTTIAGGFAVWIFDRNNFPDLGTSLWWSLQTVTTVGYGDVVPKSGAGRIVGSIVLVYSVAFLTITTAIITTSFIERARAQRQLAAGHEDPVIARLEDIATRLDRLERHLSSEDDN